MKAMQSVEIRELRYQTPEIAVVEIASEGVLCSSIEAYDEDVYGW